MRLDGTLERPRDCQCAPSFLKREARVSRREREAVSIADRGTDLNGKIQIEVADDLSNHRRLLRVLLAEEHDVGRDDIEQLQTHGRDAIEVARPAIAFESHGGAADVDRCPARPSG